MQTEQKTDRYLIQILEFALELVEQEDHDCRTQMGDGCTGCMELVLFREHLEGLKGQA